MNLRPFDEALPSPIAAALQLRSSSEASVVEGDSQLTPLQNRMRVRTGLEDAIADAARSKRYALILISGSAGGGKSLVIHNLAATSRDLFAEIVEDATHADAPDEEQYQRLLRRLKPLADGAARYSGKPLLVAMNTGMVIRLFDQLREARGPDHGFLDLEADIRRQLGLVMPQLPRQPEAPPGPVLVVNLDYRPTTGSGDSLFRAMLASINPNLPAGVLDTRRCGTCNVTSFCFVRTNASLLSSQDAVGLLDSEVEQLALTRGRPVQPRALWDLVADLLTGGEPFGEEDPCYRIADLASAEHGPVTVWRRLAFNGLFIAASLQPAAPSGRSSSTTARMAVPASRIGTTGRQLAGLDISFSPAKEVHAILSQAGIDPANDALGLVELLEAYLPGAAAVPTAASGMREGLASGKLSREEAGRGLVRARWFAKLLQRGRDELFYSALAELPAGRGSGLDQVREVVVQGFERTFGRRAGQRTYFRTEAYDARRRLAIHVNIELDRDESFLSAAYDRVMSTNPDGAELVGYRPLAMTFRLPRNTELVVDLPLFDLLRVSGTGTLPSSADLERFYQLRRAAEIIGQVAGQDEERDLLIEEVDGGRAYQVYLRGGALTARLAI